MLNIFVLAVVQGITEFLPISSSAHLILVPELTDWPDQGVLLDIAAHVGTLVAVMLYFWRDVGAMFKGACHILIGRRSPAARLTLMVIIATLPMVLAGFLVAHYDLMEWGRSIIVIGWTTIIFGVLLYVADRIGVTVRRVEHMTWVDSLAIGVAQCLALIPGTSRSGITMTAGRFLGYERPDAARFSLLLSIPAIAGAGTIGIVKLRKLGDVQIGYDSCLMAGVSCLVALITLWLFMGWIRKATFTPFVVYRLTLGFGLLAFAYRADLAPLIETVRFW